MFETWGARLLSPELSSSGLAVSTDFGLHRIFSTRLACLLYSLRRHSHVCALSLACVASAGQSQSGHHGQSSVYMSLTILMTRMLAFP